MKFTEAEANGIATEVAARVCDLPDYASPDDQPDLLQCTVTELHAAVMAVLEGIGDGFAAAVSAEPIA